MCAEDQICPSVASADGAYPISVNPGWEGQKRAGNGLAAFRDFSVVFGRIGGLL
jgi:hypothetical protein